ncbi:MAG: competence/damage-inducible protein A [Bacteroidetes bacterium]|nr:competence/damage-inducible protein A [Bacteroidota bacterium]
MNAEIINIGEELLIGQVVNTNSSWMCQKLNEIGVRVRYVSVISDVEEDIYNAIDVSLKRSEIVIITGGLGPTKDDLTKDVLAKYFKTNLEINETVLNDIVSFFKKRGMPLTELNRLQSSVPVGFGFIRNPEGTAPGLFYRKNERFLAALPGVPFEMKYMFENFIIPELKSKIRDEYIVHKTILTQGVGESFLAALIEKWEDNLPKNISLAYLPSAGIVRLRLSAAGRDKKQLQKDIAAEVAKLRKLIPEYIFGYDNDTLEGILVKLLAKNNLTLGIAESCTGGYISHLITSIPGSSACYKGSITSYSNDVKINQLCIPFQLIDKYGAVSKEVAVAMAEGVRKVLKVDYSISVTGIAGPGGGTKQKPVGLVYIAVSSDKETIVEKFLFGDRRDRNIVRSSVTALNMLRKQIKKAV